MLHHHYFHESAHNVKYGSAVFYSNHIIKGKRFIPGPCSFTNRFKCVDVYKRDSSYNVLLFEFFLYIIIKFGIVLIALTIKTFRYVII